MLLASQNRPLCMWRPTFVWHTCCCTKGAAAPNPLQDSSWPPRDKEMPTSSDHLSVVAWVSSQMETFVRQGSTCAWLHPLTKEPMLPSALPKHPWEKVASDLFEFKGNQYLLVMDYYSRYLEVIQLTATTSTSVIASMKSIYSRMESHVLWWATMAPSTTLPRWRTSHPHIGLTMLPAVFIIPKQWPGWEDSENSQRSAGANHWSVPSSTHLQSHSLPMVWAKSCQATNGPATEDRCAASPTASSSELATPQRIQAERHAA